MTFPDFYNLSRFFSSSSPILSFCRISKKIVDFLIFSLVDSFKFHRKRCRFSSERHRNKRMSDRVLEFCLNQKTKFELFAQSYPQMAAVLLCFSLFSFLQVPNSSIRTGARTPKFYSNIIKKFSPKVHQFIILGDEPRVNAIIVFNLCSVTLPMG